MYAVPTLNDDEVIRNGHDQNTSAANERHDSPRHALASTHSEVERAEHDDLEHNPDHKPEKEFGHRLRGGTVSKDPSPTMRRSLQRILTAILAICAVVWTAGAQPANVPQLQTNQSYVEDVTRTPSLNVGDLMSVFGHVMSQLPERVKVYPTENYYYVGFFHNGIRYAGNIRLDASNRDDGKVIFAYFEDTSQWYDGAPDKHAVLDAAQGVTVEKVEPLVYRVTYQGKSVIFALNDLRNVKPPAGALGADEKFLGPIFDESAVPFYLVFNTRLKIFHYVLDEREKVADVFFSPKGKDRILVGKRTGFAFYKDHQRDRKILIGAFEGNMRANNYFDGPFDQLPDNFIEGEALRDAILAVRPQLKGEIDRFGGAPDGSIRFMISPYMPYRELSNLDPIDGCAPKKLKRPDYYRCFVSDDGSGAMVARKPKRNARPK